MDGKLYYSFKAPKEDVRFFALESTYMEPEQEKWIEKELSGSRENWKIVFQHHPLYSSGKRHGSDEQLRDALEPVFRQHGVDLVLTGHDHLYERVKPQHDIVHFVAGSGGLTFLAYGQRRNTDTLYYPRSGKVRIRGLGGLLFRVESLEYWDGER